MTRVYTPDATGRCTVCARPGAEHRVALVGDPPDPRYCVSPPVEVTADTVTNKQIEALRDVLPRDHYAWQSTIDAVTPSQSHPRRQRNARALCAKIINDRAKGGR